MEKFFKFLFETTRYLKKITDLEWSAYHIGRLPDLGSTDSTGKQRPQKPRSRSEALLRTSWMQLDAESSIYLHFYTNFQMLSPIQSGLRLGCTFRTLDCS